MSQIVTRSGVGEDKEKTDTPVKDMKKKIAAIAEKEKAAENSADKSDKHTEKHDKHAVKAGDKKGEKKTDTPSKSKEDANKEDKNVKDKKEKEEGNVPLENGKEVKENFNEVKHTKNVKENEKAVKENEKAIKETDKAVKENEKPVRENGSSHSGVADVTLSNGGGNNALNGTVSEDSSDDDEMMIIDDHDQDELFPELTYDDTSDVECFESPTPESMPSRSFTRRSQAKVTRTPETPRPVGEKQPEKDSNTEDSKDGKTQKKEEVLGTDRKLRSADSPNPKPVDKKTPDKSQESAKMSNDKTPEPTKKDSPKKAPDSPRKSSESPKKARRSQEKESSIRLADNPSLPDNSEVIEIDVEVVMDSDGSQDEREPRKLDTNYSKSRVKVSPYRRSMRLADQTTSSVLANYTGNNTTMEMDITESSSFVSAAEEASADDSYLAGLRHIRGRRSYKPLKEMALRHITANRSATLHTLNVSELPSRPTGTVVGRKRKPDSDEAAERAEEAVEADELASVVRGKRMRLLDRIAHPFKRTVASTPIPRRAAEIVGINTDLPLTAPVDAEPFDPESLKPASVATEVIKPESTQATDRDSKKCIVM